MAKKVVGNNTGASTTANLPKPANSPSARWLSLILAAVAFLVYANTLQNDFAIDDATVITRNTIVTQGVKGIPELLTTPRLKGYEQSRDVESYRPVPMVTHAIEYEMFGANATIGHLFNIVFFAGCVVALFFFLCKLLHDKKTGIAFIAALIFAVHPIHTEVVANIKSRDELLCFLFAFLSLIQFVSYARNGKLPALVIGTIFLFLSLLSKETSISFVLIVPLVFFFFAKESNKRSIIITLAALIATGGFLALRASILPPHHTNAVIFLSNPLVNAPDTSTRIATAFLVLGYYLKLMLIPAPLICDYSYNTIPFAGFGNIYVILSVAAHLLLLAVAIYRLVKRRNDLWAFGILFYLITIALFSNLFLLVYSEMAERFVFFASAGFCICAAMAFERWIVRKDLHAQVLKDKRALTVLVPFCVTLASLTVVRNSDWKNNYTLFTADLKKASNNCELLYFVANELQNPRQEFEDKGEADQESIGYLNQALSIYPSLGEAHTTLGNIYERLRLFDSAIYHDSCALALNPINSIASYNLARAYYFEKKYEPAIYYFKVTVTLQPEYIYGLLNLARCYSDSRQYDSSIVYYQRALTIDPQNQLAQQGLEYVANVRSVPDTSTQNRK